MIILELETKLLTLIKNKNITMSTPILIGYHNFLFRLFLFEQKSNGCTDMNQSELADSKITEKYFINTMFVQLKGYIMLQLSYLTRATKVHTLLYMQFNQNIQKNVSFQFLAEILQRLLTLICSIYRIFYIFTNWREINGINSTYSMRNSRGKVKISSGMCLELCGLATISVQTNRTRN